MEASLLVAPKPFFSIRGKSRRCLVAAAGHGKDLVDNNGQQVLVLSPASSKVAAIMSGGGACCLQALLACKDASAAAMEAAPPAIMELYLVGDLLEPATAKTVAGVAGPALSALGFLFILRIVMSWYPRLPVTKFPYVLAYAPTEPFLAVTRKVIPPLGGVDVTPVVWFGLVSFLNEILVGPQGLLVLLSQQLQ